MSERADLAGVSLGIEGDTELELPLRHRMLTVVTRNLVTNAIRYAGVGANCKLSVGKSSAGELELIVSDNGAGIGVEHLPRLFERFYRADRARASKGSGLGLAIVKHIVIAAGGNVSASGAPGKGLTVRCTFPE